MQDKRNFRSIFGETWSTSSNISTLKCLIDLGEMLTCCLVYRHSRSDICIVCKRTSRTGNDNNTQLGRKKNLSLYSSRFNERIKLDVPPHVLHTRFLIRIGNSLLTATLMTCQHSSKLGNCYGYLGVHFDASYCSSIPNCRSGPALPPLDPLTVDHLGTFRQPPRDTPASKSP